MTKKLLAVLAVLALAPFAFAACGGDDDEDSDATTAAETTEETTDSGGTDSGGGGGAVDIAADPNGELAYEQESVTAPAGTVTISFTNDSSVPHDVRVEGSDGDVGGTEVITGEYTFYCSVDGHRDLGMEGTLTAE